MIHKDNKIAESDCQSNTYEFSAPNTDAIWEDQVIKCKLRLSVIYQKKLTEFYLCYNALYRLPYYQMNPTKMRWKIV